MSTEDGKNAMVVEDTFTKVEDKVVLGSRCNEDADTALDSTGDAIKKGAPTGSDQDKSSRRSTSLSSHPVVLGEQPAACKTWLKIIHVAPHVTATNFAGFIFATMCAVCVQGALTSLQAFFLDTVLGITEDVGKATGNLGFYDQLFSIPMSLICGVVSDWLGRRIVLSVGFLIW